jgi:hypothetical protein
VLRFSNDEVRGDVGVVEKIRLAVGQAMGLPPPLTPPARGGES